MLTTEKLIAQYASAYGERARRYRKQLRRRRRNGDPLAERFLADVEAGRFLGGGTVAVMRTRVAAWLEEQACT